jgi:hypothetical protein
METNRSTWARVTLYSAVGLGGAEAFFGLVSGGLEDRGTVGEAVGHLIGLPLGFAIFVAAMAAILRPGRGPVVAWFVATALLATVAYIGGYALAGPPVDFAASILVAGAVSGVVQRAELRRREVSGAGRCLAAALAGYLLGAVAGVGAAILIAPHGPSGGVYGLLWYVLVLAILGAVAGAVGGAVNGYALSRVWWTSRVPADTALVK